MKEFSSPIIVMAYVAAIFAGKPNLGPDWSTWLDVSFSAAFVWAYLVVGYGRIVVPLAFVIFFTLIFPFVILAWIGLPHYQTWSTSAEAVLGTLREHSTFSGWELAFPTFTAVGISLLISWRRSNTSLDTHAPRGSA